MSFERTSSFLLMNTRLPPSSPESETFGSVGMPSPRSMVATGLPAPSSNRPSPQYTLKA